MVKLVFEDYQKTQKEESRYSITNCAKLLQAVAENMLLVETTIQSPPVKVHSLGRTASTASDAMQTYINSSQVRRPHLFAQPSKKMFGSALTINSVATEQNTPIL